MEIDTRIVLVEPSHPGNIGATARAMKTMGLTRLCLVAPWSFPHPDATAMASGADDVLERAEVYTTLEEAISDCRLVVATSARQRRYACPVLSPRECAARVMAEGQRHATGLVFGREKAGLTNDEIDYCHYLVEIPANPEYASLNLAAAVQLIAYELRTAQAGEGQGEPARDPAPSEEMERFYAHLEQALIDIEFLFPDNPRHLMRRMRHLFNRARLDQNEVNILRGILTLAQRKARQTDDCEDDPRQSHDPDG